MDCLVPIEKPILPKRPVLSAGAVLILLDSRDLQAQLAKAEAEFENATGHYERMKQLFAKDSVAQQELDNAERTYKVAEAAKKVVEADLSYTIIKAPFDGVITEKRIELGELVTPGRPLLQVVDDQHLRLVKDLLRRQSSAGATVFMSTHTLSIAEEVADRIGIIHQGKLLHVGTVDDILAMAQSPGSLEDVFLEHTEDAGK